MIYPYIPQNKNNGASYYQMQIIGEYEMLQALLDNDMTLIEKYKQMPYEEFILYLHTRHNYFKAQNLKIDSNSNN